MRTIPQNDIFHCFCREISAHLRAGGVENVSEATVKELILLTLGNTVELLGTRVAMRSSKYKRSDEDLTDKDRKFELISMADLLTKMQVWAAADLGMELVSPNEE